MRIGLKNLLIKYLIDNCKKQLSIFYIINIMCYNLEYKKPKVEGICDVCGSELIQRKDDNEETITERLRVYHEQSKELIEYYEKKKLLYRVQLHANVNITKEMISEWLENYKANR